MSDIIEKKLEVSATLKDGVSIGLKNIGPILVNLILWILTIWIPYLNVGTTIGMLIGIVSKASRGEKIPYTEIFDSRYRKYMGEFFLTCGLVCLGVWMGLVFFVIPGIIIALAWYLAPLLAIDKGKNPAEAITLSNNITYGNKGRIFGITFLAVLIFSVAQGILTGIGIAIGSSGVMGFMGLLVFIIAIFEIFVLIGVQASMYKQLAGDI